MYIYLYLYKNVISVQSGLLRYLQASLIIPVKKIEVQ